MTILGIDLGTTNSACGIWRDNQSVLIPNRLGKFLTPSVVGLSQDGEILVGETAKHRLISHPQMTVSTFKRAMGTRQNFKLGRKAYNATELSALILKSLKEDAEHYLKQEITQAVISVPAYFNDIQRKATKQAGELAGLQVDRLINEPTAAAMVYGLHQCEEETQFMVLDMGGGTFDVTLIEFFSGVMEVHASAGDNFLGGEDFTHALLEHYLQQQGIKRKSLKASEEQHLYRTLDNVKQKLSANHEVILDSDSKHQSEPWKMTRDEFETISAPLLKRVQLPIEKAIRDSGVNPYEIDQVVLVGGATHMLVLRSLISKMFRKVPSGNIDPDLVVAMGAAIQAGLREKNSDLDDVVLTDVCPYSLGTAIVNHNDEGGKQGNIFMPIIERNTVVPVSIERTLCTVSKNQTEMLIEVYQGESRLVKNNIYLGEIATKVPKGPEGQETATVRYSYDMNGLLEIDVTIDSTGKTYHKQIINAPESLTEEEIAAASKKLAELKFHPREHEVNRELVARLERLYESSLGDKRLYINDLMSSFDEVLEKQDPRQIDAAVEKFREILDQLEEDNLLT